MKLILPKAAGLLLCCSTILLWAPVLFAGGCVLQLTANPSSQLEYLHCMLSHQLHPAHAKLCDCMASEHTDSSTKPPLS